MPIFDLQCPHCFACKFDSLMKHDEKRLCVFCGTPMERLVSCPAPPVFARPTSAQGAYEWGMKERARLEKRSDAYDKSPRGQQERDEQIYKLRKNGTIPPGWDA